MQIRAISLKYGIWHNEEEGKLNFRFALGQQLRATGDGDSYDYGEILGIEPGADGFYLCGAGGAVIIPSANVAGIELIQDAPPRIITP